MPPGLCWRLVVLRAGLLVMSTLGCCRVYMFGPARQGGMLQGNNINALQAWLCMVFL